MSSTLVWPSILLTWDQLFFNKRSRMVQGTEEQKANVSAGQKVSKFLGEKRRDGGLSSNDCLGRLNYAIW